MSVPNNSADNSKCDACFESSSLKKCSGCQIVYYCSSTCQVRPKLPISFMEIKYFSAFVKVLVFVNPQKSEWKLHRLECEALSKLPKERRRAVTPSLRLMIRLYYRSKLQSQKVNNQFLNMAFFCFWYTADEIFVLLFVDYFYFCYGQLQFGGGVGGS